MTTLLPGPEVEPAPTVAARPDRVPQGRSLRSYLLVPRPKDLAKAGVLPLAFAVGAVSAGGVGAAQCGRALVVWLALELLVYQARYQWNDVRGFAADQAHPDAAGRGRLPGPLDRARPHIAASTAVAALRLLLTAGLAVIVPGVGGLVLVMTIGVFGVAAVYERLRTAATGRSGGLPVPLRPALLGLWVTVGAGYAVRGLTGLALAVDLGGRPGLLATAAVTMWALGVVFVTCRWSLEAMCFASFRSGDVLWQVPGGQAREHTLGLVRWLPTRAPTAGTADPSSWRALHGRTPGTAPWNLALVVAGAAAGLTGHLLTGRSGGAAAAAALAVGTLTAVAAVRLGRAHPVLMTAGAVLLVVVEQLAGNDRAVAAALPLLVVLVAHGCFVRQCADEVGRPLRRVQLLLAP